MTKLRASRIYKMVILLVVCAASAMMGVTFRSKGMAPVSAYRTAVLQQADEKIIDRKEFPNEPFEFSGLSVKKVKVQLRQKLSARSLAETGGGKVEDWLEDLEFTIKNDYQRSITYINLELDFPETGVGRPLMVYPKNLGIPPGTTERLKKHFKPFSLLPEEAITVKLSQEELQNIKNFLEMGGFQLSNLSKVVIRIGYIIFEDGMKWEQYSWYKPNPNVYGGYERVVKQ